MNFFQIQEYKNNNQIINLKMKEKLLRIFSTKINQMIFTNKVNNCNNFKKKSLKLKQLQLKLILKILIAKLI